MLEIITISLSPLITTFSYISSVPGLPRFVRVSIKRMRKHSKLMRKRFECFHMRLIKTRTERGRPRTEARNRNQWVKSWN